MRLMRGWIRLMNWRQMTPLLFLIPAVALAYIATAKLRTAFVDLEHEALLAAANRVSAAVDGYLKSNLDAIAAESRLPTFAEIAAASQKSSLSPSVRAEGLRLLTGLRAKSDLYISAYGLLDRGGRVLVDTNANRVGIREKLAAVDGPANGGRPTVTSIVWDASGAAYFAFVSPVRGRQGAVVGYLRVIYGAAVLQQFVAENHALVGSESFAVLTDEDGYYLGNSRNPNSISLPMNPYEDFVGLVRGPEARLQQKPWTAQYLMPQAVLDQRVASRMGEAAIIFSILTIVIGLMALAGLRILRRLRLRELELTQAKVQVEEALGREMRAAQQVERDLELGRIVQEALHARPKLPTSISVDCYATAAQFVSGDTYFLHYDEKRRVFTTLLHDLTGHGIQAALKASACQMIARSIWARRWELGQDPAQAFRLYDEEVKRFTRDLGEVNELNAFLGVELEEETGKLQLFRSNYTPPILVRPYGGKWLRELGMASNHWKAQVVQIPQMAIHTIQLDHGSLIILLSDGIMESSRAEAKLVRHLQDAIAADQETCTPPAVSELIRHWRQSRTGVMVDDQTVIVIQWRPQSGGVQVAS